MRNLKPSGADWLIMICLLWIAACKPSDAPNGTAQNGAMTTAAQHARHIVVLHGDTARLATIIDPASTIDVIGEGFVWTEGPVWIGDQQMLLFTDVPANTIYAWTESGGTRRYLQPSGFTGGQTASPEPGANGLALDRNGYLVLCQHGDRRIARMESSLREPQAAFTTLAGTYKGKRFNSPNDLVINSRGQIFFTDPPYGLPGQNESEEKELPFQGVYRIDPDGSVHLLTGDLSRPNGIALSPDEQTLYVANSDSERAIWMAYTLDAAGNVSEGRVFYDATAMVATHKGLPDGLKVNRKGILFATGPGGVWIFDPSGEPLGRIDTGEATANCALNTDQSILYMCADDYLMRVRLRV